jgi:DNA-binding SARP family transcriptional activator/TolB-like protein
MLSIRVLGDPLLEGPRGPVTGRAAYRRRLALLSILAAARGRPVGRERLIGLLWPDYPSGAARHTLSEALYVLRRELGEAVFVVVGGEVGLSPAHVRTDLDAFETALEEGRTEDAVRAYGGPFLGTFAVPGMVEFERWAESERERLAGAYARALQSLAESAESADDLLRAAEWWRRLTQHDPFSSRVALRLARTLWNAGEHAAALRHAEAHAAWLHAELEIGPEPELAEFVARLRAESIPLPAALRAPGSAPSAAGLPDASPVPGPPLSDPPPASAPEPPSAPASAIAPGPDAAEPPARVHPASHAAPVRAPRADHGRRRMRCGVAAAAAALAAIVAAGAALASGGAPAGEPDPHRIAVLYFEDDSRGGELEYLAGGLTEMLIDELDRVPALDVISRSGVKPYRSGTVPLEVVAARLRVGTLVEGSVQRAGDSVRVAVQLIDARTQSRLDSRAVVRPLGDVLALEAALSAEVGGFLRRRLGREVRLRETAAGTRSAVARSLVLRAEQAARDAAQVRAGPDPLDAQSAGRLLGTADSLLRAAAKADPAWTRPLLLRGEVALAAWHGAPAPDRPRLLRAARRLADGVLAREPASAPALQLRGTALWRTGMDAGAGATAVLDSAEHDLRAAVAADASLAGAWGALARLLLARGRLAEAGLAADRALAADTYLEDAPLLLRRVFSTALAAGDVATADAACGRGAAQFPEDWRFLECRLTLLREDLRRPPDPALAWRLVARLDRLDPPSRARADGRAYAPLYRSMVAAAVSARAGQGARAREVLARARREAAASPELALSLAYDEACLLLQLGDTAAARGRVDAYLAARPALRPLLARDPLLRGVFSPAATDAR